MILVTGLAPTLRRGQRVLRRRLGLSDRREMIPSMMIQVSGGRIFFYFPPFIHFSPTKMQKAERRKGDHVM